MAKLVFLLVALACYQASTASIIQPRSEFNAVERGIIDDAFEACQKKINELYESILDSVKGGVKQVSDIKGNLKGMLDAATEEAKGEFDSIVNKGLGQINEWKAEAKQLGVNVKECYDVSETKVKKLPNIFLDKMIDCAMAEYNVTMEIIMDSETIITNLINKFNDLKLVDKLKKCGGWSTLPCILGISTEAFKLTTTLPGEVAQKVKEVYTFVQGVPVRLQVCAIVQTASMQTVVTDIVTEVIQCIKTKLGISYALLN